MGASLLFDGDIELLADIEEDDGYKFEALSTTKRGKPVPVEVTLASFLRDGSIVSKTGDENREMVLPVRVTGADLLVLALGEKRLNLATGKRTTLVWTPHDGIAPPTVFEVLTSSLEEPQDDGWDLAEVHNRRTYNLRLVCLPFGFSVGTITDDASTPPTGGGSVFYSAESTMGWGAFSQGVGSDWVAPAFSVDATTVAEGTGSIKSLMTQWTEGVIVGGSGGGYLSPAQGTSRDEVTGVSVATGSGGYLSVAVRGEAANTTTVQKIWTSVTAGVWVEVPSFTATAYDANGFVHYVWPVAGGQTIIGLRFQVYQRRLDSGVPRPYTWYDDFELLPAATTDHQIVKQLTVEGSARTTGSLHVASPTDSVALGKVLAITAPTDELPAGFQPDGRHWVTQGTTTVDGSALGGSYYSPDIAAYSTAAGKPIFDVPVGMLTAGPYTMVALVKADAINPTLTGVQAQLRYGSTSTGPVSAAEITVPAANLAAGWHFIVVGTVYLPPLPMQSADSSAKVRLLFKGAPIADVYMIPAWQVGGRAVADFSIVDCGSATPSAGGSSSHLWIDSPSTDQPRGGWWRGPTADRVNAQSAWPDVKKPGLHAFKPGALSAFLVSTGAQGPTLELQYRPAWFGNAAS